MTTNQKMRLERLIDIAMDLTIVRDEIKLESDSCDYTFVVSRDEGDGFIDVIVYNRDNHYEFSGGDIYDDEFVANLKERGIDLESEDWYMSSWDMGIIRDTVNELVKKVEELECNEASK